MDELNENEEVPPPSKLERGLNSLTLSDSIPTYEISLKIICKTNMDRGHCFIGLDTTHNRLLRPIFRTSTNTNPNACYWPRKSSENIHVGSLVRFRVKYHPDQLDQSVFRTPYPHRTDDILVDKKIKVEGRTDVLPESLLPLSKQDIFEIFPQEKMVEENRYIIGYPVCQSVGILLTNERSVTCHTKNLKPRVYIDSQGLTFDFPNKAVSFDKPVQGGNRNCLVILGLARPWRGDTPNSIDSPPRCYILVIGIILFG